MCGLNVCINGSLEEVQMMQNATQRRGTKNFIHQIGNVIVSFDWLAITDSSAKPFFKVGNWTVFLNGYISNYKELAKKYNFDLKTNCDTEVLANMFDSFGVVKLNELNGFFSIFAIYNEFGFTPNYYCFTDRYAIKQLYQYKKHETIYISSEVKGILALEHNFKLDKKAVEDWKYSLGVMTENTIYKGIERVRCLPFHKPRKVKICYTKAKIKLHQLWLKSIQRNKVNDLNDCVFLSGGIDSGIIAKYMKPDYSFSVDYLDSKFSEIENIKLNSQGTHMTLICNKELAEKSAFETMKALDDLKAGSCYTNFALTEMASHFATVIYSGAGGDEVFGGYSHRNNKDIEDVINRSEMASNKYFNISHDEYNWKFLKAVLVVEDRMAGWHTMETRYPLLDNDFVDFALSLPDEYLEDKRILKDVSGLHFEVLNAKKKGFSNPHFTNKEWVKFTLKHIKK